MLVNNFSLTDTLEVLSNLTVLFIFIFSVIFETQFNLIKKTDCLYFQVRC